MFKRINPYRNGRPWQRIAFNTFLRDKKDHWNVVENNDNEDENKNHKDENGDDDSHNDDDDKDEDYEDKNEELDV